MSFSALTGFACALAAATLVRATNQVPVLPPNSQDGVLAFPITCQIANAVNQTFQTMFTATAPVFGGTGEEIYYTDTVASIDIPAYFNTIASLVGATQATAAVTAYLSLINASPATLLAYNDTISNISLASGKDTMLRLPPGSGVLPPVGPATLGVPNKAHRIELGNIAVDLTLYDAHGKSVLGPIPITCGKQDVTFILGSVSVNSTSGLAPYAPANGFQPQFPPVPNFGEYGALRFPYECDFGALGSQLVDVVVEGAINTYYAPGDLIYLNQSQGFIRVPEYLTSLAQKAFPNATMFSTTITEFDILFSNASPEVFNVAKTPLYSNVAIADDLIIPIPESGTLSAGPVTAGVDGTPAVVSVGNATAKTDLKDSDGNVLFTLPITCSPPAPLELIAVPITSQKIGNYTLGINQMNNLLSLLA